MKRYLQALSVRLDDKGGCAHGKPLTACPAAIWLAVSTNGLYCDASSSASIVSSDRARENRSPWPEWYLKGHVSEAAFMSVRESHGWQHGHTHSIARIFG